MALKASDMFPAILSFILFLWLINYLKNCDCRSYSENSKDRAVKRHFMNNGFILSLYYSVHSDVMSAEGTVRIKFYFLLVQVVAIDVLHFLSLSTADENSKWELDQSR